MTLHHREQGLNVHVSDPEVGSSEWQNMMADRIQASEDAGHLYDDEAFEREQARLKATRERAHHRAQAPYDTGEDE